jgi:hypothetical protein
MADEVLTRNPRMHRVLGTVATAIVAVFVAAAPATAAEEERVGPERCGECHKKEYKAWLLSSHSTLITDGYDEDVTDEVEQIVEELDLFDVESDGTCDGCHYNFYRDVLGEQEITATDCEACHGPGAGWVDVHSSFGAEDGKQIRSAQDESPEHRRMRVSQSLARGWRSPTHSTVALVNQCFVCHLGPDEEIVDDGGHVAGSRIDLVSWFSGEVRHNFQRTAQGENAALTPERRRMFHIIGRALDVEHGIRGLAEAYSDGRFLKGLQERIEGSLGELKKVNAEIRLEEVGEIIRLAESVPLKAGGGSRGKTVSAADRIHAQIERFAKQHDGSGLAAIDPLIATEARGRPATGNE